MKCIVLFFVFFSFPLFAQFVEYNYGTNFSHFPISTPKMYGIGNRGFNDQLGLYNPKYQKSDSTLSISLSLLSSVSANRTEQEENEIVKEYIGNNSWLPEFSLRIKNRNIQFQLALYNDLDFSFKGNKSDKYFYYPNNGVTERIEEKDAELKVNNKILQLSVSTNLFNNTSLSASMLKNKFLIDNNWEGMGLTYENNFFSSYKFLFSLNQKFFEELSVYVLYKTQNTDIKLNGTGSKIAEDNLIPDVYLYNPGNVGYGLQYDFFNKLKISLEFSHQFYEGQILYPILTVDQKKETYSKDHHIWNNEIVLGANFIVIKDLNIGISFSKYLKYDDYFSEFRYKFNPPSTYIFYYSEIQKPYSLMCAIEYIYQNYSASLHYQYSSMGYSFKSESGEKYPYQINENNSFIKLNLGIGLF